MARNPFRRRRDPLEELRAVSFQSVWGTGGGVPSLAGMEMTLRCIPVYSCVDLIAGQVAAYPLQSYRTKPDGDREKTEPGPQLIRTPTLFGTTVDWVHRAVVSMALRGNAYGLITERDADGIAAQIEWLHPDEIEPKDNTAVERPVWLWKGSPLPEGALVHIPSFAIPGRVKGLSPVEANTPIETALLAQTFARDWFKNGSIPAATLESKLPVTEDEARLVKQRFKEAAKGKEPVVLGSEITYRPIGLSPSDAALIESLKMTATQIAGIYHVPAEMVGGAQEGRSITYANVEQRGLDLINYAERPFMVRFEEAISKLLPGKQFVKFNVDAYNRADLKTRYEAHAIALGGSNNEPFKTVDEVRATEDLPPMPKPKLPAKPAPQMQLPGVDQPADGNGQQQPAQTQGQE